MNNLHIFGMKRKSKDKRELCEYVARNPSLVSITTTKGIGDYFSGMVDKAPDGTYHVLHKGIMVGNKEGYITIKKEKGRVVSVT